jgi:predicted RNA-binding protein YlxR (DUF448 family)
MIRFCVACHTRHESHHLVPFHRGEANELLLGRGKRTAWVCIQKKCLTLLSQKPRQAYRSLKIRDVHANTCLEQVQEKNKYDICRNLSLSQQSGVVFSGRIKVLQNRGKISFLISCASHSTQNNSNTDFVHAFPSKLQIFHLDITPRTAGKWIGKGERTVLGLSQNRHSLQLLKTLHQYQSLR